MAIKEKSVKLNFIRMLVGGSSKIKIEVFLLMLLSILYIAVIITPPWIYQYIFGVYIYGFTLEVFINIAIVVVLFLLLQTVFNLCIQLLSTRLRLNLIKTIRAKLLSRMLAYPYGYFLESQTGEIINYLIPEIDTVSDIILNLIKLIAYVIQLITFFIFLFLVDILVGIVYLGILLVSTLWASYFKKGILKYGKKIAETNGRIYSFYFELFPRMKEIKSYNLHIFQQEQLMKLTQENREYNLKSSLSNSFYSLLSFFPSFIGSLLIIAIGYYRIQSGDLTFGMVITIMVFAGMIVGPIQNLFAAYSGIQNGWPALNRLELVFGVPVEPEGGLLLPAIRNCIETNNLYFSYKHDRPILTGLDIKINCGSFISIIGESGSGKSTLINLLVKLFHVPGQSITLDNEDLNGINTDNIRRLIGVVSQESFILNDTIRNNIDINNSRSDEELLAICRDVEIGDLLNRLPAGLDTILAEQGKNLSGGEKQRLMIARCLSRKTNVIILDEATSALDIHTEKKIIEMLLRIKNERQDFTVIAITHRSSFVHYSDYIYILDKGRIVESGDREALSQNKYFHLFEH